MTAAHAVAAAVQNNQTNSPTTPNSGVYYTLIPCSGQATWCQEALTYGPGNKSHTGDMGDLERNSHIKVQACCWDECMACKLTVIVSSTRYWEALELSHTVVVFNSAIMQRTVTNDCLSYIIPYIILWSAVVCQRMKQKKWEIYLLHMQ